MLRCHATKAVIVWIVLGVGALAQAGEQAAASSGVKLLDNLGVHHHAISTSSQEAQAFFDQGFRLAENTPRRS